MGAYITDQHRGHSTTPGATSPSPGERCVGSPGFPWVPLLTTPEENAGDGLSSFSEKTRTSNHLQVSHLRQQIFLSYFKILTTFLLRIVAQNI